MMDTFFKFILLLEYMLSDSHPYVRISSPCPPSFHLWQSEESNPCLPSPTKAVKNSTQHLNYLVYSSEMGKHPQRKQGPSGGINF